VKNFIRNREFFKIASMLETVRHRDVDVSAHQGWMDKRTQWNDRRRWARLR